MNHPAPRTLRLGYLAFVVVWAAVCALAQLDKNTWPVLMFAVPLATFFIAVGARPWVHDSSDVLISSDPSAGLQLLSRFLVPTLAALGAGVGGWLGAYASWLAGAKRGAGVVVFGANPYLGWGFPPLAAVFSALLAIAVLLLLIVPVVAAVDAVRLRRRQPREAIRLSAFVGGVLGFAVTITSHFLAFGLPADSSTDRFASKMRDLAHEVDLLMGQTPPGTGLWVSLLAWVGVALFASTAVLLSKARRLPR